MHLQDIFDLYEDRLKRVELKIKALFQNQAPVIPLIGSHLLSSGGKRLRPLFHLISADMAGYGGDAQIAVAGIIESIHTASLLHDDVVDMARIRRGKPTANSLWGNQVVILVGDYLYSTALRDAVMLKNQRLMETLSEATTRMTEGELLQLHRTGDPDITEEEYIDIISAKTGALISAACRSGAILGGLSAEKENALAVFGMRTGIVFQMADDILDYMADEGELGKKLCKDLEEGKITLPLLYLLKTANSEEIGEIKDLIKDDLSAEGLRRIMHLLRKYNAIEVSLGKAESLLKEAKTGMSAFPDTQAKEALITLADYSLHRLK